ncbi:MAG: carboxypeptidase-like regulatory domain-containing protein, partial [Candidatus Cryptobacteroides sp.]
MKKLLTLLSALVLTLSAGVQAYAQKTFLVEGVVVDEFGPITGAGVMEQGTTNGMATDFDGRFSFKVSSPDAIIEISFVGYATLTFKANELPKVITLKED